MSSSVSEHLLLALPASLQIVGLSFPSPTDPCLRVVVASVSEGALCPTCQTFSVERHERYSRQLSDLPCVGQLLQLRVELWRYRCANPDCPRRTFVERLSGFASTWAHRTERLKEGLRTVGRTDGGRAGERQARRLGLPASYRTILRLLHAIPLPEVATPRVLGVDDWAFRKGRRYGTLLYDLERHVPVALLPDRETRSLSEWLKANPGVEVISRDRAEAYAAGAREGAPNATQVADRWHLLKNLTDYLDDWVERERKTLEMVLTEAQSEAPPSESSKEKREEPVEDSTELPTDGKQKPVKLARGEQQYQEKRERRKARYDQVIDLHGRGLTRKAISEEVGISERTVLRFLAFEAYPERKVRSDRGESRLVTDQDYIIRRIDQGCYNARQIWRELKENGHIGSYASIYSTVKECRVENEPAASNARKRVRLERWRVVGWLLRGGETMEEKDRERMETLKSRSESFSVVYELAQGFAEMIRKRQSEKLTEWMKVAGESNIRELKSFVTGLKRDQAAVEAGMSLPWSNGPVEGFVNRIKEIKRRMYGRAGFDLLCRMVLLPP